MRHFQKHRFQKVLAISLGVDACPIAQLMPVSPRRERLRYHRDYLNSLKPRLLPGRVDRGSHIPAPGYGIRVLMIWRACNSPGYHSISPDPDSVKTPPEPRTSVRAPKLVIASNRRVLDHYHRFPQPFGRKNWGVRVCRTHLRQRVKPRSKKTPPRSSPPSKPLPEPSRAGVTSVRSITVSFMDGTDILGRTPKTPSRSSDSGLVAISPCRYFIFARNSTLAAKRAVGGCADVVCFASLQHRNQSARLESAPA